MNIKIPNYLTIGRIIIVPFFVIAYYLPGFYGDIIPLGLFLVASFTDFLDGLLARMYKEESKLGELLDPIADKIIVAAALILLIARYIETVITYLYVIKEGVFRSHFLLILCFFPVIIYCLYRLN